MKIVKAGFLGLLLLVSVVGFSQKEQVTDSVLKEKKLSLNVDIVSRYLWRGQCWGGNYMAVQPSAEYAVTSRLSIGSWATTNFKKDYFYPDNENYYKGYREIDFYASYQLTDFLQVQIWDYYWPSVSRVFSSSPPRPWSSARPPLESSMRSRGLKAWKFVMTIFALLISSSRSLGTSSRLA